MTADWYRWQGDTLLLYCYLKPRARNSGVIGLQQERLHVQVAAPPVDGRANTALCDFLASAFGVAKRQATLTSGTGARYKTVAVENPRQQPEWFTALAGYPADNNSA